MVGESVVFVARLGRFGAASEGARDVCNDSFGRLGAGGDVGGIAESMVLATCFRSSEVCGVSSRCALGP